jgi:hypothetical protein
MSITLYNLLTNTYVILTNQLNKCLLMSFICHDSLTNTYVISTNLKERSVYYIPCFFYFPSPKHKRSLRSTAWRSSPLSLTKHPPSQGPLTATSSTRTTTNAQSLLRILHSLFLLLSGTKTHNIASLLTSD